MFSIAARSQCFFCTLCPAGFHNSLNIQAQKLSLLYIFTGIFKCQSDFTPNKWNINFPHRPFWVLSQPWILTLSTHAVKRRIANIYSPFYFISNLYSVIRGTQRILVYGLSKGPKSIKRTLEVFHNYTVCNAKHNLLFIMVHNDIRDLLSWNL